jgi:hypothetical protein
MAKDHMLPSNLTKTHNKYRFLYVAMAYIIVTFRILARSKSVIFYYME